jgi:hypothetical protein
MTREGALLVVVAVAVALVGLGTVAWLRRRRRDADVAAPVGEIPTGAAVVGRFPGLYVATTRHDEPLERLAIRGLAFRSRAELIVTDAGVAIDLTGQPRMFLATAGIRSATQATVAIDRVVERDGLVRLVWTADGTAVDTYFRPQEASARHVADAVAGTLTPTTGNDA